MVILQTERGFQRDSCPALPLATCDLLPLRSGRVPQSLSGREYTSSESMNSELGVPRSLRFLQGAGLVNDHIFGMQFLLVWQDAERSEAILRGWRPALYHLQLL
jgi:hypothetical protein